MKKQNKTKTWNQASQQQWVLWASINKFWCSAFISIQSFFHFHSFLYLFFRIEGANQTATQSLLINIAAKAGAKAGAELGLREAKESGARAGAMAGAEAGERAGAAAGVEAARKAATEVATKTLKEALQKLGTMNKSVGCKSSIFDYYINHYRPPVGR